MKKLIICIIIIVTIGATLYYFNKDDSIAVTKDDKITLIFDNSLSSKIYKTRREMLALLSPMNIPQLNDPNTLLNEQLTDNSIIFYLPQGSLKYAHISLLEAYFKNTIAAYNKLNFNTKSIYKINFDTTMQPLPLREDQLPLIIKSKPLLSQYQQVMKASNKHYELSFIMADPILKPINQWQKNCLIEFKPMDQVIPYTELKLSDYLPNEFNTLAFKDYKQSLLVDHIEIIQDETLKKLLADDSSLKFILLPSTDNQQVASLYLYYGKTSGNQPCQWPTQLPMKKIIYQETPFAGLIGYQLSTLY